MAKLHIARNQLGSGPASAKATLDELQQEVRQALKDLRELAHGIHPPLLSDRGLVKAIEARAGSLPMEVRVTAEDGLDSARYSEEVEGTAYFFVCEGVGGQKAIQLGGPACRLPKTTWSEHDTTRHHKPPPVAVAQDIRREGVGGQKSRR